MAYRNLHRPGNAQQRLNGDNFLPALYFTQVLGVKVGFFRKLFLRKPELFTVTADRFSEKLAMSKGRLSFPFSFRHNLGRLGGQVAALTPTSNMLVFYERLVSLEF